MNTRFHLLLSKAGIDVAHNIPLLLQLYEKAINPNIYRQIILNGTVPDTLDAYMLRVSTIDRAFKMMNIKSAFTNYQGKKGGRSHFRWQPSSSFHSHGEPMDVDAISTNQSDKKCFNCRKQGHFTKDCRQLKEKKCFNSAYLGYNRTELPRCRITGIPRVLGRNGQKKFLDMDDDDSTIIAPIIGQTNVWYSSKKMEICIEEVQRCVPIL